MSNTHEYEASDAQYQVVFRGRTEPKLSHRRRSGATGRQGKMPVMFNGIHRRRRKKFSW